MGIADHVNIHRAAAARALNEMKNEGLINSETKHVIRGNRNRKVYFLTYEGIQAVREVEKSLLESRIRVRGVGKEESSAREISDVLRMKDSELTLLVIANELKNGTLSIGIRDEEGTGSSERSPPTGEDGSEYLFSSQVPSYPYFTGRKEELQFIETSVTEGHTIAIVIHGIAGIGKTSLAAKAAHTLKNDRNIGWVNVHQWTGFHSFSTALFSQLETRSRREGGKTTPGKLGLGIGMGKDEEISHWHFEEILKQTLTLLKRSPRLIVIDDAHNANPQIQKYLKALFTHLSSWRKCTFILTSRTMPNFYDRRMVTVENSIREITLSGLNFDDAFELVSHLYDPEKGLDTPASGLMDLPSLEIGPGKEALLGKEAFGKVYTQTLGHPFALELISRMGSTSSKLDFQRFLSKEIVEALTPQERTILEVCSVFRHPASMEMLVNSIPDPSVSMEHVETLLKKNLIRSLKGNISIHGLIKDFFQPRITPDSLKQYHSIAVDYYTIALKGDDTTFSGGVGGGYDEMGTTGPALIRGEEHSLVVERIHHLVHSGSTDRAFNLIIEWADELICYGNSEFFELLGQIEIEGVDEERRKQLLEIMGDAQAEFGLVDKAIESYVKRMEFEDTDPAGEARLLQKIGELEGERGDIDASIRLKKRSLGILLKRRDLRKSALMYNELGLDHWKVNRKGEARKCFHKAVDLLGKAEERYALSRVLLNLAQLESEAKHHMEADSHLKESLKRTHTDEEKIEIYHMMGDFSSNVGERKKAILNYQKGLKLAEGTGEYREMLSLIERLTEMYLEDGEKGKALDVIQHGITFIEEGAVRNRDDERGQAHPHFLFHGRDHTAEKPATADMGKKLDVRGKQEMRDDSLRRGRGEGGGKKRSRTQETIRRDNYRFAVLCEIAESILSERGEPETAADYLEKASMIYRNFNDDAKAARLILRKGMHEFAAGKEPEAVRSYRNAFALYERISDPKGSAISLLNFTAALEKITKKKETIHDQLVRLYEKARSLSMEAGYDKGVELSDKKLKKLTEEK